MLITLGPSDLHIAPVCLGTQHLGASLTDEAAAHDLLDAYLDLGGRLIDTAPDFGGGRSQHIVGRWLSARPGHPALLSTKFGFAPDRITSHPDALRAALSRSLDALRVPAVSVLWCQGWDLHTPLDLLLDALASALSDKLASHFALTDWPAWAAALLIERARARGLPTPIALQLEYSVIARDAERDLLPLARHADLGVLAWGVTAGGALIGGAPGGYYEHTAPRAAHAAQTLLQLAGDLHTTPAQLAAAWVIARGCVANIGPASADALRAAWPSGTLDAASCAVLDACAPPAPGFPQRYWDALYCR
jgi:aryl-alcohol dehydrogenase-like predicted oxidoreductase